MESGTTIVGIFILLACMLPFVMLSINRKVRNKKNLQQLKSFAHQNNYEIATHELWANNALGMDKDNSMLFFISEENETKMFQKLSLAEIERCNINTIANTMRSKSSNYTVIEKIELILHFKQQSKGQICLVFYSASNQNLTVTGELSIAEKWNKLINDIVR